MTQAHAAETPRSLLPLVPRRSPIVLASVLGVVLSGAFALGLASVMSGYEMGGPPLVATLIAVVGGMTWIYLPRIGYWVLVVDGLAVVIPAGIGLVTGALPWLLVGFWGGSAILLATFLHVISAGPVRVTTATLIAVISLLVLSALGLTEFVRATWAPATRAEVERIATFAATPAEATVWVEPSEPAPGGGWECTWLQSGGATESVTSLREALTRGGWNVTASSAGEIVAVKGAERVKVLAAFERGDSPAWSSVGPPPITQFTATLSGASAEAYH